MARPQFGIAQSGEAQHRPLGLETHGDSRGVSSRPGARPSERGHSTPSGTGFLSPYAQGVPDREGMHPHAQDVPVEFGRPGLTSIQCRSSAEQFQPGTRPGPYPTPGPVPDQRPSGAQAGARSTTMRSESLPTSGSRVRGANRGW